MSPSAGTVVSIPIDDLIEEALSDAGPALRGHRISVHIAPALPLATVDPALATAELGQALTEAIATAPVSAALTIGASYWNATIDVRVAAAGGAAQIVSFPGSSDR